MDYSQFPLKPSNDDILWRHLGELPYFRAMVRAVEDSFYQGLPLPEPVLDLGSGDGQFARAAFRQPLAVGLDPWWPPLYESRGANAYHLLVQADGAKTPFAGGTFASVVSNSVLEHIPHVDAVVAEVARVLRPDGLFIFCVPNHRFPESLLGVEVFRKLGLAGLERWYRDLFQRISRHQHCDSLETWTARLSAAGFVTEAHWDYFNPAALHRLEAGHVFGLPALFWKKVAGRWVLVPTRSNLAGAHRLAVEVFRNPLAPDGVYSFYIARKVGSH